MKQSTIRQHFSFAAVFVLMAAAFLPLILGIASARAVDNERTRQTLRGLKGVYAVVEDLRLEIEEEGLTRNEIHKTAVETLRAAGIPVLSEEAWQEAPGSPWLYLYAHVMRREFVEERVYVFNISIELKQKVSLTRAPEEEAVFATTWSRALLGKSGYLEDIRKGVQICLDDFIDAYGSMNPLDAGR